MIRDRREGIMMTECNKLTGSGRTGRPGIVLFAILALVFLPALGGCEQESGPFRQAAVAGSFYPGDPAVLREMVEGFLNSAGEDGAADNEDGQLLALIAPHAGYIYSGAVAGEAYSRLRGKNIHTVIIVGPSHKTAFSGLSVYARGRFATPLGNIEINDAIAEKLIDETSGIGFYPKSHDGEHSIETQLPFLQVALGDKVKIVPVLIGSPSSESFQAFTRKTADIISSDPGVLLVASTDLSHYHDYDTAVSMDSRMLEPMKSVSIEQAENLIKSREGEMCGAWPVIYTMGAARELGASHALLYKYANSGDTAGDRDRVVGYAAMGFYRARLSEDEQKELLDMAVKTIDSYVRTGKTPQFDITDPRLMSHHGVFVTINRGGSLRGCIGSMTPRMPLYRGVVENAKMAATRDRRFPPLSPAELDEIEVEVSVLSPFYPVDPARVDNEIELGVHGLYLVKGNKAGVFLPQVPVEQGWDLASYLRMICSKAGLPDGSWKAPDARLYAFTANVFGQR